MWPAPTGPLKIYAAGALVLCAFSTLAVHLPPAASSANSLPRDVLPADPHSVQSLSPGDAPHFASSTYSVLHSSGNRVSHSVQRLLGVQGSLDDLKLDISKEYVLWRAKKKELLVQHSQIEKDIQGHQAKLLEQASLQSLSLRLRTDLVQAVRMSADLNKTHDDSRQAWSKRKEALHSQAEALADEIHRAHQARQAALADLHNKTDATRKRQLDLVAEIMAANKSIADLEEKRAKHTVATSREEGDLLQQVGAQRRDKERVRTALEAQRKLQWEHDRLAEQAHEVVKKREEAEQQRLDCDEALRRMNAQLAALVTSLQHYNGKIRRCQLVEAENTELLGKVNKCKAAIAAGN